MKTAFRFYAAALCFSVALAIPVSVMASNEEVQVLRETSPELATAYDIVTWPVQLGRHVKGAMNSALGNKPRVATVIMVDEEATVATVEMDDESGVTLTIR